ncbi:restriction endonuclease subunit S [Kordia sp.]|uniref:restriction endonuclease subunit S n=1 Tax=Kordia sp. TaxID=1965332 RepID=UPI003D6B07DD
MKIKTKYIPELLFFQEGPGVRKYQFKDYGVKLLNGGNINNNVLNLETTNRFISEEEAYGKYSHFLVEEGDLLIASSGIVVEKFDGKIAFAKKEDLPLCMNTSTIRFRPSTNELDLKYFYFFLKTNIFKSQIQRLITGSAQLNFGPTHLKKIKITYPDIKNQRRIAQVLSNCENLIHKRKESIALLDELLKSTFLDMFGDPVRNERGLKTLPLIKLASISRGKFTPRPRNDPKYFDGKYPFIQTGDINRADGVLLNYSQTLNELGITVSKEFKKGTIVIALVGATIGETAILGVDCYATDSIVGITSTTELINNVYIEYILRFWKPVLRSRAPQAARANINNETLKPLPIPIPEKGFLNKFMQIVEKVERIKKHYQTHLKELENLYGSISQKAFKGELDLSKVLLLETRYFSNDPNETSESFKKKMDTILEEHDSDTIDLGDASEVKLIQELDREKDERLDKSFPLPDDTVTEGKSRPDPDLETNLEDSLIIEPIKTIKDVRPSEDTEKNPKKGDKTKRKETSKLYGVDEEVEQVSKTLLTKPAKGKTKPFIGESNEAPRPFRKEKEKDFSDKISLKAIKEAIEVSLPLRKEKRDITNMTILDYYGVPEELQDIWEKAEFEIADWDIHCQFLLKDTFSDRLFTFQEIIKYIHNYFYLYGNQDFDKEAWKKTVFKFLEAKKPLMKQFFDKTDNKLKLKLTNEAFKA